MGALRGVNDVLGFRSRRLAKKRGKPPGFCLLGAVTLRMAMAPRSLKTCAKVNREARRLIKASATLPTSPNLATSALTCSTVCLLATARTAKICPIPISGSEKLGPILPARRYAVIRTSSGESVGRKRASAAIIALRDDVLSNFIEQHRKVPEGCRPDKTLVRLAAVYRPVDCRQPAHPLMQTSGSSRATRRASPACSAARHTRPTSL
jgi:hypothetical protein